MAALPSRLLLGTRKGLLVFERKSGDWQLARHAHAGNPISYADWNPATNQLWACVDYGHWGNKLHRSADWGATWQEVKAPRFPEGLTLDFNDTGDTRFQRGAPATVRYLWVMQHGGKAHPQRLYIGTEPGALFRSDDGGESFQLIESLWHHPTRKQWFGGGRDLPGIHSICIDPRDPKHLYIAISCAGVLESRDDGATWAVRNRGLKADFLPDPNAEVGQDPHFVTCCATKPDVMWQQNHTGIFRSIDGGANWTEISETDGPARYGFPIAAHETSPETAWVVPFVDTSNRFAPKSGLCVSRTENGGKSWTALRNGLPQQNCFDMVYRHALDIRGNTLAFASTTGNAWLSDDGGESWQTLSHHLPPVYSVRFAKE